MSDQASHIITPNSTESTDNRRRENEASKSDAATNFAKDVKNSLLFRYHWGKYLSSAPLCVSLMGSCYAVAAYPGAQGMSIDGANVNWSGTRLQYVNYYPGRKLGKVEWLLGALISRRA